MMFLHQKIVEPTIKNLTRMLDWKKLKLWLNLLWKIALKKANLMIKITYRIYKEPQRAEIFRNFLNLNTPNQQRLILSNKKI